MSWADIKKAAKCAVHDTFKYERALYTRKADGKKFRLDVRLHKDVEVLGGDDEYAQSVVNEVQIIIPTTEGEAARGDTIFHKDFEKAYQVSHTYTPDGGFQAVAVV